MELFYLGLLVGLGVGLLLERFLEVVAKAMTHDQRT